MQTYKNVASYVFFIQVALWSGMSLCSERGNIKNIEIKDDTYEGFIGLQEVYSAKGARGKYHAINYAVIQHDKKNKEIDNSMFMIPFKNKEKE